VFVKRLVRHSAYPWHSAGAVLNVAEGPVLQLLEGSTASTRKVIVVFGDRDETPNEVDRVYMPLQTPFSSTL
jgi:hypothetical protein